MRKIVFLLAGIMVFSAVTPVTAASVPTEIRITEVNCSREYVELYNPSSQSVAIGGMLITDKKLTESDATHRFIVPSRVSIPAKSYQVFKKGSLGLPFALKCGDDRVRLGYKSNKWQLIDEVAVANHTSAVAWGLNAKGTWQAVVPSPGKANVKAESGIAIDNAAWLYKPSVPYQIKLQIPEESLAELSKYNVNDYFSKEYQVAYLQVVRADNTVYPAEPMQIGLRLKIGFGSRQPLSGKPGLKIKFNKYLPDQTFFGLKKMTLNNFVQDPSRVNETLAYELFRSFGIPAPRTGYTSVEINGTDKGNYLNLEVMDDVAMAWWMPDMQHVYEAIWDGGSKPDLDIAKADANFEIDEGGTNREDLYQLLRTMEYNFTNRNSMESRLEVAKAAAFMAIEKYISHWDGYSGIEVWTPNNFYIASNSANKFYLMPAGMDQTFGTGGNDGQRRLPIATANGVFFKKCMKTDYCASSFRKTLFELETKVESLNFASKAVEYRDVANGNNDALAGVLEFLNQRGSDVDEYLADRLNPNVRWGGSKTLKAGTSLSAAMLNAYADVPGVFKYSVKVGSKLRVGKTVVKVTFTPADESFAKSTASKTFIVN